MLNSVLAGCTRSTAACERAKGTAHFYLTNNEMLTDEQKLQHARAASTLFNKSLSSESADRLQSLIATADLERLAGNFNAANLMLGDAELYFTQHRAKASERISFRTAKMKLLFDQGEYKKAAELAELMLSTLQNSKHVGRVLSLHGYRAHFANYEGLTKTAVEHSNVVRKMATKNSHAIFLAYALRYEARAHTMSGDHTKAAEAAQSAFNVLRQAAYQESSTAWLDISRADAEIHARKGDLTHAQKALQEILGKLRTSYPGEFRDQINVLDMLGAVSLAMGDAAFASSCHRDEILLLKKYFSSDHPWRLRAELHALRAAIKYEPDETQKMKLIELVRQLKTHLPEGSVHARVLSELLGRESSKGSTDAQKQLVLIF
jgi:hypothetical protein